MHAPTGHPPAAPLADFGAGRPLTPFEHLMLIDDRPGYPMCFYEECAVDGPLREDRLQDAVRRAAGRHPLLCSRVAFRKGRPVWLDTDVVPTVVWNPPARSGDPWRPFDLRRESGVRIVVLSDGDHSHRVVMQVHHSTCDGVAACEFFGDIWARYAGLEPRPFSSPRAARAGTPADQPRSTPPVDSSRDINRETWAFASFRPTALAHARDPADSTADMSPAAACPPGDPRSPPYAWLEFDRAFSERLRISSSADGVSLNDTIVAAVMRAAFFWNARAGHGSGRVRITMPVNLRKPGLREPARNDLGYAFLDRRRGETTDARALAMSIATATRWILEHDAAAFFLGALRVLARWPLLLRLTTRLPICISTVVVSNIGDPSRRMRSGVDKIDGHDAPDDLIIRRVLGVPPLRPRTRAAIGVTTYAGRLALCCLFSASPDPHEGARRFLELVRQELVALAGTTSAVPD